MWSFTGDGMLTSAPLVVNDTLYIGSYRGNLYALDPETGDTLDVATLPNRIDAPDEHNMHMLTGLASGDGKLIVPSVQWLVAFEGTPPTATPTPTSSFTPTATFNSYSYENRHSHEHEHQDEHTFTYADPGRTNRDTGADKYRHKNSNQNQYAHTYPDERCHSYHCAEWHTYPNEHRTSHSNSRRSKRDYGAHGYSGCRHEYGDRSHSNGVFSSVCRHATRQYLLSVRKVPGVSRNHLRLPVRRGERAVQFE